MPSAASRPANPASKQLRELAVAFGNEDLVRFKPQGPVYFIFNDLIGSDGEKTRDGREHNFWVYELKRIDGTRFVPANANQPGFPKWVWFKNKENHEETTQLTSAQKSELLKKHQSGFRQ